MQIADMHSTTQFGQIGWPPSYTAMPYSDNTSNTLPITLVDPRGTPFLAFVQDPYEAQSIHHGMSLNKQNYESNSCASQKLAEGLPGANQSTAIYPIPPHYLLKSDVAAAAGQAGHVAGHAPSHLCHQTSVDFKDDLLRNRHINSNDNTFMEWLYPPTKGSSSQNFPESTVQWGSDSMFDAESRGTQRRVGVRQLTQFRLKLIEDDDEDEEEEEEQEEEEEEEQDGDAEDAPSPGSRSSQARSPTFSVKKGVSTRSSRAISKKAYTDGSAASIAGRSIPRREPKGQRKKLTIEQKRSNHIRHEKKRRGLIRDGFNDLTELVPELRGGTWSRSRILFTAVEFLKTLLERNDALQEELNALKSDKTEN
ncbi:hypothetical protein BB8028_0004g05530 [Beauveria bassiana]|uniref:BHLH domain-containing protein n=2 Tax=Beauveria bassiana TaxID=176275 RepID=A0A2S7YCP8_BEABA|nr:hypothetical protein BB8028_0004g05530 [Beauveria bassiana]